MRLNMVKASPAALLISVQKRRTCRPLMVCTDKEKLAHKELD